MHFVSSAAQQPIRSKELIMAKAVMRLSLSIVATGLFAQAAAAHVSLEKSEAEIGKGYKAVLKVPHGCDGEPTTAVRIDIPEGYIGVKPMPQAGLEDRDGSRGLCRELRLLPRRHPQGRRDQRHLVGRRSAR